jgi:serine/threonine protein kinase
MSQGESHLEAADPLVGRVLSERYRVLQLIGEGGIGRVYLAEHLGTQREVALKVLLPEFAGNLQLVDTFLEEARTVSRLGHENIIDIYYGGRSSEGYAFLVMEHLKGLDLADTLSQTGPMPWERCRRILLQIVSALETVHRHGVLHGDIKPANLFLVDDGGRRDFVKVLDFGVAKAVGLGRQRPADDRVPILGTPQYIAPEQVLARSTVDARADLYSLGVVMYQMLTGTVPFTAETPLAIISKHAYEPPVPPRTLRPDLDIPQSVEAVVLRALEKEPDRRWKDMREMGDAISRTRLMRGPFDPPDPVSSRQFRMSDPAVLRGKRRRQRLMVVMGAALIAAAAGLFQMGRAMAPGVIDVKAQPDDVILEVDGTMVGAAPLRVSSGVAHQITARRPGYVTESRQVQLEPGQRTGLEFQLRVSADTGLEITSVPEGALIWVDGKPVATTTGAQADTPYIITRVRPGRHVVELRLGNKAWLKEVDVPPDKIVPVQGVIEPEKAPG